MIPVRLELTNFLSYRDKAILEFGNIHLACIAGPNGAGKSSIMDAMTWALFGQSRSRSDDDLVNRMAGDDGAAEVRFTFDLEGLAYRVIRRKRPRKTTILELQMAGDGGDWKPLSESKIRETQAAIENLLRMNYDTFINASFFLQGKADQFTTRTASQRKEILAELLGVTQWEHHRERAAAARKEAQGAVELLGARLEDIDLELEEEPFRRDALERAEDQHRVIVEKREMKELLLNEAQLKEETRKQQRNSIKALEERENRLQDSLQQARATISSRRQRREDLALIIGDSDEISAAYAAWQSVTQEVQTHQALAEKHNQIYQAMQPHELELAAAQSSLEHEQRTLAEQAKRAETSRGERDDLEASISEAEAKLKSLGEELDHLNVLQQELHKSREILQHTTGVRRLWQQELDGLEEQTRRMKKLAEEKQIVRKNKQNAQELLESLGERITAINVQQQVYARLQAEEQGLRAQQPSLREEMDHLKERIDTLETAEAGGACPLCDQPLTNEHRQRALEKTRGEGKQKGDRFRTNEARLKELAAELPGLEKKVHQGPTLERERQAQEKRLAQSEARLEEIGKKETEWSAEGEKRLAELAASLADKSELKSQSDRVAEFERSLSGKTALQEQLRELHEQVAHDKARLSEIERLLLEWESEGKTRLAEVNRRLAENDIAAEARRELALLQEELNSLGYDAVAHQAAAESLQKLAEAPDRFQTLKEARAALTPLQEAIDDLEGQIAQREADLEEQQQQLKEAKAYLEKLDSDGIDLEALRVEVEQLQKESIAAAQQVGVTKQRLNVLDDLRAMKKDLLEQKESMAHRVQRLKVLERSCGRKGVQALLIEHALPDIEEGANQLLERLTGGEMRVKFDTQRQLKSRDALAETLDIVISDRAGERPYENYSGGEQFRINFAIRLALSQLLAKRAGARLQTLVIDEGFGSQDPLGRQRLIEAINAVQEEFACILVITHIDELREAFPTRIEVNKGLNGSEISVY